MTLDTIRTIPTIPGACNMIFDVEEQKNHRSSEEASREDAARALLSLVPTSNNIHTLTGATITEKTLPNRWAIVESWKAAPPRSTFPMTGHLELSPTTVDHRHVSHLGNIPPMPSDTSCDSSVDDSLFPSYHENKGIRFYVGSVSLALAEDEESLSPLHCFMRKYCVEAVCATAGDITTPRYGKSHGRSIVVGQVGMQCVHCKHRSFGRRQERSVCFPSSLKNIYHSMETWQRRHSSVCQDMPLWAKRTMAELMGQSRSTAGGRRQYWETSAIRLGMEDTPMGIRFIRTPGDVFPLEAIPSAQVPAKQPPSHALVFEDDRELVTEYLYALLAQMETCYFAEQDSVGGRSKVKNCPIGYAGLQCKHCAGKAGFGRYFPASIDALISANSDRNIFNHIMKCRRCPVQVKQQLQRCMDVQKEEVKNRRGKRKGFFQRVWQRMHGPTIDNH